MFDNDDCIGIKRSANTRWCITHKAPIVLDNVVCERVIENITFGLQKSVDSRQQHSYEYPA